MRHRAPDVVRIVGAYPPPLPRPAAVHVTRYDRRRRRRRPATRAWTALSASLATAGVAVLLLAPAAAPTTVRQEVAASVPSAQVPVVPVSVVPAAPAADPAPAPLQLAPSEPVTVDIPVLGVSADVVDLGLRRDGSMETPGGAAPVGWYTGSPSPGSLGPAVLAGHVDWDGHPGSFYGLRELLPGDVVSVGRTDGSSAVFVVDRVEEHAKDAFPTEEVYGDTADGQLRLITCGGSFDSGEGEYLANVVVFATLVVVR